MALLYGLLVALFVSGEVLLGLRHVYGLPAVGWGGVALFGALLFFSLKKRLDVAAFDWVTVAVFATAEALYAIFSLFAFLGAFVVLFMLGIIEK